MRFSISYQEYFFTIFLAWAFGWTFGYIIFA